MYWKYASQQYEFNKIEIIILGLYVIIFATEHLYYCLSCLKEVSFLIHNDNKKLNHISHQYANSWLVISHTSYLQHLSDFCFFLFPLKIICGLSFFNFLCKILDLVLRDGSAWYNHFHSWMITRQVSIFLNCTPTIMTSVYSI